MSHLLDNVFWHALSGPQKHFSEGVDAARRYATGFSPIVAFPDPQRPDFDALAPFCRSDEHFYCDGWSGAVPRGWQVDRESTMFKMVWDAPIPSEDAAPDAVPLRAAHAAQAVALASLTNPGPFGMRTIELGEYFGYFDGDRLVAMTGERSCAPGLREISGVCTHPDHQGRGLARKLGLKVIRRQLLRGETPFLHVMSANTTAHGMYRRMGFRDHAKSPVRVVSRRA
jgi:ribosomal protein S18 acetylase RimI-like enzyme